MNSVFTELFSSLWIFSKQMTPELMNDVKGPFVRCSDLIASILSEDDLQIFTEGIYSKSKNITFGKEATIPTIYSNFFHHLFI